MANYNLRIVQRAVHASWSPGFVQLARDCWLQLADLEPILPESAAVSANTMILARAYTVSSVNFGLNTLATTCCDVLVTKKFKKQCLVRAQHSHQA